MRDGASRLAALADKVSSCTLCPDLAASRLRAVCGRGSEHAQVMIVAPAPSEEDERASAAAGHSLFEWLTTVLPTLGESRKGAPYVTALLKCVPRSDGGVRDALDHELTTCFPYLSAEMSVITPHYVLPVGRETSAFLLRKLFGRTSSSMLPPGIRVLENPSFRVVPLAGPLELEGMTARDRARYVDQLRSLAARIGL